MTTPPRGPHDDQPVVSVGLPVGGGRGAVVMLHGRNAAPANILELVPRIDRPDFAYLAPAANDHTWYPYSFMAETERNEPALSSALHRLQEVVGGAVSRGVPVDGIVLLGFSQGACLAAEFAARHPTRYGGIVVLSGGLIGPPGTTWPEAGSFDGTPVFLGCSDIDSHVPLTRVHESAEVFTRLGADVTTRIYPSMGHLVNDDEIEWVQALLDRVGR